ncbi:MAG: AMP-binding protein [Gammaproteobacteria bacterium]|nr:AMP-binding protein [Gammaproteobacteria bacterium]
MSRPDVIGFARLALPGHAAIRAGDQVWTYRDLAFRARRLAWRLHARGIGGGDRVAILSQNHIAHFDLLIAAPMAQVIAVPLNIRLGPAELAAQVAQVTPKLLLVDAGSEAVAATLGLPTLRLADYERWLADVPAAAQPPAGDAPGLDGIHMILFTGGSTGAPKGACLPYRQTLGNADDSAEAWALRPGDVVIQATPCFHAAANVLSLPLLRVGGTVVLAPRFDPADYLRQAVAHRATILFMVPTMFAALADDPGFAGADLSSVRMALSGGAPCPQTLCDRYLRRGIRFRCGFGMTEAGVNCFLGGDPAVDNPQAVGLPMPRVRVDVRRGDGSRTDDGEVGELCLSGPQICAGYWGPHDAAAAFRDGWLHTGDLARRDAAGRITIRGRLKDLYISGGENIYPSEIEAAVLESPEIAEACVFGWPDARWGEVGIAFVVRHPGLPYDEAQLRAALRQRLAGYKIPAAFVVVPSLPRSAVGKVLKTEAREQYRAMLQDTGRFGNVA